MKEKMIKTTAFLLKIFYTIATFAAMTLGFLVGLLMGVPLWKGIIISVVGCLGVAGINALVVYLTKRFKHERANDAPKEV